MSDNEHTPPPAPFVPPVRPAASGSLRLNLALLLAAGALGLSAWQWQQQRVSQMENGLKTAAAQESSQQTLSQLREQLDGLVERQTDLEDRLDAVRGDTEALQNLRQELARGREEVTLIEVEQAITLASQQLQLAGNVQVARLALQAADSRLARLDRPQFLALRKAVAHDLAKLNAAPLVDVAGISLRLEEIVAQAESLPLAAYGRPLEKAKNEAKNDAPAASGWQATAQAVWAEFKGLVRIQRFDSDDAALLAPGQAYLLRENLKLRLLNARLALLSRDAATFAAELKQAQSMLDKHFLSDDKAVQAARDTLRKLQPAEGAMVWPTLADSQTALRQLHQAKEKR
jgi:uroporphyrin-3 C-methyltransferase